MQRKGQESGGNDARVYSPVPDEIEDLTDGVYDIHEIRPRIWRLTQAELFLGNRAAHDEKRDDRAYNWNGPDQKEP